MDTLIADLRRTAAAEAAAARRGRWFSAAVGWFFVAGCVAMAAGWLLLGVGVLLRAGQYLLAAL